VHTSSTELSRSAVLVEADGHPDAAAVAAGFRSPPITEVSLAISFQPLGLGVINLADLWREKFATDFPRVQEQAPIRLPQERFEEPVAQVPPFAFELLPSPSLPRLWFLNNSGTELLQVQADWFARNWRKTDEASQPYPLYPPIREAFARDLDKLGQFSIDRGLGQVQPVQAEITYINHIDEPDLARVLKSVQTIPNLPEAESTSFAVQYVLARDGQSVGRLYVQASKAIHRSSGKPVSVLTITGRGRPLGEGLAGALAFLDFAAKEALNAFIHSTRPEMHELWRHG
jgi:uncharacterized protein (TIGR04255 family)